MTIRLTSALRDARHLKNPRVLCEADGTPLTRQKVQYRMVYAAKRANVTKGVHILRHTFCSHLAMRGAPARAIQELAGNGVDDDGNGGKRIREQHILTDDRKNAFRVEAHR